MGPNRRALEREQARTREEQRRLKDEVRAADAADAVAMIEAWNARLATGRRVLWSPTLGAAALAGYRWLTVYCPGCGTVKDVDLAKIDRHPGASISSLIPSLSCRTCRPNVPFVEIRRLGEKQG
jgi:hypothetical protein